MHHDIQNPLFLNLIQMEDLVCTELFVDILTKWIYLEKLYSIGLGDREEHKIAIDGDLLVAGSTVNVETQNLRVEDKNIELAITSDSTVLNNSQVDGGGIILKSSQLDKEWVWKNTAQAWTSSDNIDLAATKGYKVDGAEVLNKTEVGSTVTQALGLTQIGTLQDQK